MNWLQISVARYKPLGTQIFLIVTKKNTALYLKPSWYFGRIFFFKFFKILWGFFFFYLFLFCFLFLVFLCFFGLDFWVGFRVFYFFWFEGVFFVLLFFLRFLHSEQHPHWEEWNCSEQQWQESKSTSAVPVKFEKWMIWFTTPHLPQLPVMVAAHTTILWNVNKSIF